MIQRYSSRRDKLDENYINKRLKGAISYDRIAGFFRSSLLEIAGEEIEALSGSVRIVCNSDIDTRDVQTAKAAYYAQRRSWCEGQPEKLGTFSKPRFSKLYTLLTTKSGSYPKLQVKILPNDVFGLIHGKAGIITYPNGKKISFLGSVNESLTSWKLNYELLWEDDSPEAAVWVQEEFDALWSHPLAYPLSDFIIGDIKRTATRREINIDSWKRSPQPEPASGIIEVPIYRKEFGLWAHQKYFVNLAFEAHQNSSARFILADQVGLGKTVQLALSAMLMALTGPDPILIIVPKTLLFQWQDEMRDLLDMPSAVWNGSAWVDESGYEHVINGVEAFKKCPRRIGIISRGLITSGSELLDVLKTIRFECVIVDEAHHARRKKITEHSVYLKPDPNNLMRFLWDISPNTKSMLLATATPVQLHPIEAWDLLDILSRGSNHVLGEPWSEWKKPEKALAVVMREYDIPQNLGEAWKWVRNPMPPDKEDQNIRILRHALSMSPTDSLAPAEALDTLRSPEITRLKAVLPEFAQKHSPFIRHIIRRTRKFLETTIDPYTSEYYLKPIEIELTGEADTVILPPYLKDAYNYAGKFCELISKRVKGSGFLKTLLLRRIGSTIYAGRKTTEKMLKEWGKTTTEADKNIEYDDEAEEEKSSQMKEITSEEREQLENCIRALDASKDRDPKYEKVVEYLIQKNWIDWGCIIFSQYYDSVWWLAQQLSENNLPDEKIGIYAGADKSGIMQGAQFRHRSRDEIKKLVQNGDIRLLIGTDAASEGLNLQRLGTLINLDLPWNPTRLEQRKGRIQRIGQVRDKVFIYNMRYQGSVEDRVHELLSYRLESIYEMFGQVPDILEDVWIDVVNGEIEKAKQLIESVHPKHPFDERYNRVEQIDWESCSEVLDSHERIQELKKGWKN